jgi:hypothetical protein
MTPLQGYEIKGVYVDSAYAGRMNSYTFTNVYGNHTISVEFGRIV